MRDLGRIVVICCITLLLQVTLTAQPGSGRGPGGQDARIGELRGVLKDKVTQNAIPFANVVIYRQNDSTVVDGTITNDNGLFEFKQLPFGRFYLQIQYVGYPPYSIDSVFIRPREPNLNLGIVELEFASIALDEVVITGQKSALEFNLDRRVINIDQNIAANSSTVAEIMQTIPSVSVDIDGNVSLRGSSNVIILVDGRPSMLTSLDQMPANMVESIELITNPSARYDPDGTSGMINIVLKKKREPGYNGMFSVNLGTGNKLMSSLNFNYRQNKLNLFVDLNMRFFSMKGYSLSDRENSFNDTTVTLIQDQTNIRDGNFNNFRAGFDYFFNSKNTLSFSANVNIRKFNYEQDNSYKNYFETAGAENLTNYFTQNSVSESPGLGKEFGLNYKKTFDRNIQELTIDFFYSDSDRNSYNLLTKKFYNNNLEPANIDDFIQNIENFSTRENVTGQLNYVQPVGNGGRIETGYKFSLNNNTMNYIMLEYNHANDSWVNDTLASNEFIFEEQLHSGYFIYSNTIKEKFKYQAGLRAEQAFIAGNQLTMNEQFKRDYFNLFPSVHLKYDNSERHSYSLSYSRRVNRPGSRVMNPFINYSDPINLSKGNPNLNPEFINSYELGYSFFYKKTAVNANIFYRNTDGIVSQVMTIENNSLTSMTTYENINKEESYGIEFIVSQDLFRWWKLNANYSHYRTQLYGQNISTVANDNITWELKINSTMKFPKSFDVLTTFNYESPEITTGGMSNYHMEQAGGIGIRSAHYTLDFSMKKGVFKDKGSITLSLRDALKSNKHDIITYGDNYYSSVQSHRDSRVLFLGFSYRINEYKKRRDKPQTDGLEEIE
ncbi:MAG: outer membrane beta-barrel family protein [Bacteroidales bacterium]|nr:outer membrane beta-barrel family protein [Bacteroidales bacterium]